MVETLKAKRLNGIGEYYFSSKLREIEQLNTIDMPVLNLGIGSPDLDPPESVKRALSESLSEQDFHRYQSYKGIPELRESFQRWYHEFYDVSLDPDHEILPLIGSKEGIMHISMAFLDPGDEVLIPNPGYATYRSASKLAGATPIEYQLKESNGFLPDFSALESQDLTCVKLMWVNYPHMPTGTNASDELFKELIRFCRSHNIILVNDNPYSFTLTERPISLLKNRSKDDLVLELNSLSKSHNMAGWRVGLVCGNEELIQQVLTFKSNMDSGMFKPVMRAAMEALKQDRSWYESLNKKYAERRELIYLIADSLGCHYRKDQVGMFLWARIPSNEKNGESFSDKLLKTYKLFVPPGMIFGSEGDQFIRFSLCSPTIILNQVLERINRK